MTIQGFTGMKKAGKNRLFNQNQPYPIIILSTPVIMLHPVYRPVCIVLLPVDDLPFAGCNPPVSHCHSFIMSYHHLLGA
jgi:hypothetical protein